MAKATIESQSNKQSLVIDTAQWCSQMYLAKKLGVLPSTVNNWVARGQIESIFVPELSAKLVRNILTIKDLKKLPRKSSKKLV